MALGKGNFLTIQLSKVKVTFPQRVPHLPASLSLITFHFETLGFSLVVHKCVFMCKIGHNIQGVGDCKERTKFYTHNHVCFVFFFLADGTYLGVASHDNMLDIYNIKRGKKRAVCRGNSSYLTHFDWDNKGLLSACFQNLNTCVGE